MIGLAPLAKKLLFESRETVSHVFINNVKLANAVFEESSKLQRWGNTNYFKEDPSDAWGKSSLRDSVREVNVNDIIPYETPAESRLKNMGKYKSPEYGEYDTGSPVAIRLNNKIILLDGHHRLELAKRAGKETIKVAIKDVSKSVS